MTQTTVKVQILLHSSYANSVHFGTRAARSKDSVVCLWDLVAEPTKSFSRTRVMLSCVDSGTTTQESEEIRYGCEKAEKTNSLGSAGCYS